MAKKSEIDGLKTREQKFKDVKWGRMFVSRKQITSEAFLDLKTAAACQVFMIFLNKCQWKPIEHAPRRKKEYYLANQGEIQFTYDEALEKWGISNNKFTKAIDELVRVGLIDIAKSGFGLHKDKSLYAISDRWETFGTDEFVVKKRQKRTQHLGFSKGNSYGRNSDKKQNQHSSTTVAQQL
ncbi:MAG: hypothetical protein FVQ85_20290 [Planctomycetes bacterium]|nr:hypothetical protein [Planctomycetota bacterium]